MLSPTVAQDCEQRFFFGIGYASCMECRETTLLSNAAFLATTYNDPRYQVLLKYSQKTIAQVHFGSIVEALANAAGVS